MHYVPDPKGLPLMTSIALDSNSAFNVSAATAEAVLQLVSSFLICEIVHLMLKSKQMQATMAQQIAQVMNVRECHEF